MILKNKYYILKLTKNVLYIQTILFSTFVVTSNSAIQLHWLFTTARLFMWSFSKLSKLSIITLRLWNHYLCMQGVPYIFKTIQWLHSLQTFYVRAGYKFKGLHFFIVARSVTIFSNSKNFNFLILTKFAFYSLLRISWFLLCQYPLWNHDG